MRRLMWFALGFGAACALCVYLLPASILLWGGISLAVLSVIGIFLSFDEHGKIAVYLCLGLSIGFLWFHIFDSQYLAPARNMDGKKVKLTIEITDFSFDSNYGITVDGKTQLEGRSYQVRTYLHQKEAVSPGTQITGEFELRYTAPGGNNPATYHGGNGILLLAYQEESHEISIPDAQSYLYLPAYLRRYLQDLLQSVFPEDVLPFAKALLLGDTTDLDYKTNNDLTVSGIRHVAAVSGLHVSILFTMVYFVSGRKRGFTVLLGVPVLLIFMAISGFSPSVVRAGLMQLLMLLALLFKKEYDPPTGLAFAAVVMCFFNPLVITSVGFQLSVASVAGIFLFAERISGWLLDEKRVCRFSKKGKRLYTKVATSVSISLGAMLTTTPLTAFYFGTVSIISPVTNLLCLPMVTMLFCGIAAACMLGTVWLPLGTVIAWMISWVARLILGIAHILASIPLAAVYTESIYIVAWLVVCYLLLAVFLILRQKRPVILLSCAALSLSLALLASWAEPLLDDYRVTVLDVGQGQCVLLQSGGRTYMVDCGGSYADDAADKAAAALLSQGITQLDGLIVTHYDADHVGGAVHLLKRVSSKVVILPEGEDEKGFEEKLLADFCGEVIRGDQNIEITWDDSTITVFASEYFGNSNESSLCVLFHEEECDILITGDRGTFGETILVRESSIPKLDVLVVGHHGSSGSTGEALLAATKPETAVISVGANNPYRHPAKATLERLEVHGCIVRRTDLEGTIIIRG